MTMIIRGRAAEDLEAIRIGIITDPGRMILVGMATGITSREVEIEEIVDALIHAAALLVVEMVGIMVETGVELDRADLKALSAVLPAISVVAIVVERELSSLMKITTLNLPIPR